MKNKKQRELLFLFAHDKILKNKDKIMKTKKEKFGDTELTIPNNDKNNRIKEMKDKWLESGNSDITMDNLEMIVINEPKVSEAFNLLNRFGDQ